MKDCLYVTFMAYLFDSSFQSMLRGSYIDLVQCSFLYYDMKEYKQLQYNNIITNIFQA